MLYVLIAGFVVGVVSAFAIGYCKEKDICSMVFTLCIQFFSLLFISFEYFQIPPFLIILIPFVASIASASFGSYVREREEEEYKKRKDYLKKVFNRFGVFPKRFFYNSSCPELIGRDFQNL